MKRIKTRTLALLLSCSVLATGIVGGYEKVQAASLSAGAALAGESLSFLESLFMAGGMSLGLDMILKTQNDINNWDWGDVLDDPATQGQIDNTESKINEWYDNAVKDWYKNHGGSSDPTPTPGTSPPVTVAPINPDDLDIPKDWATLKKNATDKGLLAMGAATAYCVKEAVKGWWDDIVQPVDIVDGIPEDIVNQIVSSGFPYYMYTIYDPGKPNQSVYLYLGSTGSYRYNYQFSLPKISRCYRNGVLNTSYLNGLSTAFSSDYYKTNIPEFRSYEEASAWSKEQLSNASSKLPKTSLWPSVDLKDDYDNNRSPNFPELATPTLRLPSLDEIKDLWKQGKDDDDNRPTYVTNFITNHTVQPTPEPKPTKKPEVNPNPGGGTDPDPEPTPSTTPAVVPDPGGGSGGGSGTEKPDNPKPEDEIAPYKADIKKVFPFCIPFDLIHLFKVFDAEPEAPVFTIPIELKVDNPFTGKSIVDYEDSIKIDLSDYEQPIKVIRIFEVIFFLIGLMLITRSHMIKG